MITWMQGNRCALWVGLILALVLAGCDTSHDIGRSPSPASSTTTVATPAGASYSPASGTASATASSAATTPASRTASGQAPVAAALRAALLTPRDLPPGYTAQSAGGAGLGGSAITGCPALVNNPDGVSASATVGLTDAGTGSTVVESLLQMSSAADAVRGMAGFAAMPVSCRSFSGNVDGFNIAFGTVRLAVSPWGDQTTAARMTGRISGTGAMIDVDVVVVRHGALLMEMLSIALTADTAFTKHVAQEAYAAVAALP
jgi:hypothetical protein